MWFMARLYSSGHSSPDDDELGRRLVCKLLDEETGRRQDMYEANVIWAVLSVHEKGAVIWQESLLGWEVEGNLKGIWL
jgi:hypothetical protein